MKLHVHWALPIYPVLKDQTKESAPIQSNSWIVKKGERQNNNHWEADGSYLKKYLKTKINRLMSEELLSNDRRCNLIQGM